jgi:hypothetical protein
MTASDSNGSRDGEATVTRLPTAPATGGPPARRHAPQIPTGGEVDDLARLASHLARSGFFKDAAGGYQAFAKLLFGRDLGLSATAAMTGVHLVEGKPELSANLQAQMVRCYVGVHGERYDYKVLTPEDRRHVECKIVFYRVIEGRRELLGEEKFTMQDAERAELTRSSRTGKPSNYLRYPRNMLFARAMSNGVAFHCPEVTGGIRVYHQGEIEPHTPANPGAAHTAAQIPDAQVVEEHAPPDGESDPTRPREPEPEPEAVSNGETAIVATPREGWGAVNEHGMLVRQIAKVRGVGDVELANLMVTAAGGQPISAHRALTVLPGLLERVSEPIALRTLELIEQHHPPAAQQAPQRSEVHGEDFASYQPPPAA